MPEEQCCDEGSSQMPSVYQTIKKTEDRESTVEVQMKGSSEAISTSHFNKPFQLHLLGVVKEIISW